MMNSAIFFAAAVLLALSTPSFADYIVGGVGNKAVRGPVKSENIQCPPRHRPVGLAVTAGTFVHGFTLHCQRYIGGRLTGEIREISGARTTNGNHVKSATCPANHFVSGIDAMGGLYVDQILTIRCTPIKMYKHVTKKSRTLTNEIFDYVIRQVGAGGRGGDTIVRMNCSNRDPINRLRVRFGSWLDHFEAFCSSG